MRRPAAAHDLCANAYHDRLRHDPPHGRLQRHPHRALARAHGRVELPDAARRLPVPAPHRARRVCSFFALHSLSPHPIKRKTDTPHRLNAPDTAFGTVYSPTINDTSFVIYNFDIPASYAGKTCDLVWALPDHNQLETSSYTESGVPTELMALVLGFPATVNTTLNTVPGFTAMAGTFMAHGVTVIDSTPCAAGTAVAYALLPGDMSGNYSLTYFQDYNPCPIGLYVIPH